MARARGRRARPGRLQRQRRRAAPTGCPPGLAERLAKRSEAVADKLDAGDQCGAAQQADVLEDAVEQAIAEGMSDPFQAELTAAAKKAAERRQLSASRASARPEEVDCEELEGEAIPRGPEGRGRGDEAKELDQQIKELDRQLKECARTTQGERATARETNERPDARRRPLPRRADARAGRRPSTWRTTRSSTARSRSRSSPSICRATRRSVSDSSAKRMAAGLSHPNIVHVYDQGERTVDLSS